VFEGDSFAAQILAFMKGLAKIAASAGFPEPPEKGPPLVRSQKAGVVIWNGTAKALLDQLPATDGDRNSAGGRVTRTGCEAPCAGLKRRSATRVSPPISICARTSTAGSSN
jgi:hypothetical protein